MTVPTTAERRPRLSRARLIEACVRIADTEGVEAVTMRRLGAELSVDPTAVYRHFRDKDELLSATADHLLMDALAGVSFDGTWKHDIRAFVLRIRDVYLQHPGLASFVATAESPMPNEARLTDAGLAILAAGGFSTEEAVRAFEVLEAYTVAVSSVDAATASVTDDAWRDAYARLPADDYPHLHQAAGLLYRDHDARFRLGLDLILGGIERDLR
jgi:AcrR family transcriptional regulator